MMKTDAHPGSTALAIESLSIEFVGHGGVVTSAVSDLHLSIRSGEILGIVGESGAGKSTVGAAVIGLLGGSARVQGAISIGGKRVDTMSARARHATRGRDVSIIFQDPLTSLDPLMTIGRQIEETIRRHLPVSIVEARAYALELLKDVDIADRETVARNYPHQLSGGMRQRVVIALALCSHPKLIIADEPTTALDVSTQAQIIKVLRRVCFERGVAMMLITHDMGVIAELTDRVAVMYGGRMVETGATADIIGAPKHPYTRGLIRCIPQMRERIKRLPEISESTVRLSARVNACNFHPRCPDRLDKCVRCVPPITAMQGGRVACWLYASGAS